MGGNILKGDTVNIRFDPLTSDTIEVLRTDAQDNRELVATLVRVDPRKWELRAVDGAVLATGRPNKVSYEAIRHYCTCGECPWDEKVCPVCGSKHPGGRSCDCFDNGCE